MQELNAQTWNHRPDSLFDQNFGNNAEIDEKIALLQVRILTLELELKMKDHSHRQEIEFLTESRKIVDYANMWNIDEQLLQFLSSDRMEKRKNDEESLLFLGKTQK